jgi:hypothetical protein
MPLSTLLAILDHHSVDTELVQGRIYAATSYTVANSSAVYDEWVDVTDFSQRGLYAWLGY